MLHEQMPCQGLDLGYAIAKRPPLSDFVLSPTRIFKIDKALISYRILPPNLPDSPYFQLCFSVVSAHFEEQSDSPYDKCFGFSYARGFRDVCNTMRVFVNLVADLPRDIQSFIK